MPEECARQDPAPEAESARGRLLTNAVGLFNRKGYAATTVREIVEAAGVTKPVLYYYFGSKEGIFLELMQSGLARLERIIEEARSSGGSAFARLVAVCDGTFSAFMENIPLVTLMNSIFHGPPQGAPHFDMQAFQTRMSNAVSQLLEEGINAGEFKGNLEDMTWVILGAIRIATDIELVHPEMSIGREGLRRLLRTVFHGLAASPGAEGQ